MKKTHVHLSFDIHVGGVEKNAGNINKKERKLTHNAYDYFCLMLVHPWKGALYIY